jgi:hypothetical protein
VCGGPCGVLVYREIKEEGSLDLSDRLREGKGSLEPNLGKTNHRVHSLDFHLICFPLSPGLDFSSNANPGL